MDSILQYSFEWDPRKATSNHEKHNIRFAQAATIFSDPNTLSLFDQEHSQDEERWITLGLDDRGRLLVVVHTFTEVTVSRCKIRIISARKATASESKQYQESL